MDRHENERWGCFAEWTARLVFDLSRERARYYDARDVDDAPVEIKACKRVTGVREDAGKYFIRRENHRDLVAEGGYYIFVVYDPTDLERGPILGLEMKPAEWLDGLEYSWTWNGERRDETVIRPPWTVVMDPGEIATSDAVARS